MVFKNSETKTKSVSLGFDEGGALAALANVKSPDDEKRESFLPCVNYVYKAREKGMSWETIAKEVLAYGDPKLTALEISKFFHKDGRVDPSPRAARRVGKPKAVEAAT